MTRSRRLLIPLTTNCCCFFYRRIMLRRARLCHNQACVFHTGWNTSKIISRSNNLGLMRGLTQRGPGRSGATGTPPKLEWNGGGARSTKTSTISPKRCKIRPRLLWRTNRKSHTHFRLVPKPMTLDDPERPNRHSCRNRTVLRSPP